MPSCEGIIIAREVVQLTPLDEDDVTHDVIEEVLIMRDNEHCALRLRCEVLLKPDACIEVEVIGWLIEEQQLR